MSEADAVRQGTQFLSIPVHSAATVQALGTSTLGRCDRGQSNTTDFYFTLTYTPRGHLQSSVDSTGDLKESQHSGSLNSFDLFNFIANK